MMRPEQAIPRGWKHRPSSAPVRRIGFAAAALFSFWICGAAFSLEFAAAWLFDERTGKVSKDMVAGNDAVLEGAAAWGAGQRGGAMDLPGNGDSFARVAYGDWLDAPQYTFAAWVRLEDASWQYIAWADGEVWPEPRNARHIDIWVHQDGYVVFICHTEGGGEARLDGKTVIADGEWHHVAKVYGGGRLRLYIDGELDGQIESPELIVNGEDDLWIGARPGKIAATGLFDEVAFLTEPLSRGEIQTLMEDGLIAALSVSPEGSLALQWAELRTWR